MLIMVLGMGIGCDQIDYDKLCYYKVIIMIDVDVDGVYIVVLLIIFFYCLMFELIYVGCFFLVQLLFYCVIQGLMIFYVCDDVYKDQIIVDEFKGSFKVDIGCFKGFGEMILFQFKQMIMDFNVWIMVCVVIDENELLMLEGFVEMFMGKKLELCFVYIQEYVLEISGFDIQVCI